MDLVYLKKLIKIFEESKLSDLNIEEEGIKIQFSNVSKQQMPNTQIIQVPSGMTQSPVNPIHQPFYTTGHTTVETMAESQSGKTTSEEVVHVIKSPIVGSFYRSPSPDSQPFVEVGSHVSFGQPLCIIEAMKLMNEIESDINGTIEKILVQNSTPIEFNQPLFVIKPD